MNSPRRVGPTTVLATALALGACAVDGSATGLNFLAGDTFTTAAPPAPPAPILLPPRRRRTPQECKRRAKRKQSARSRARNR
jgi:hypothetical protein